MYKEATESTKKIIYIHGLGQGPSSWGKTISFMPKSDQSFCLDLFAMLNCKESTYANMYQAFSGYCNDMPGALNLCGLSLGAILALNYAIDYPEKVQSLVLIAAQYRVPKGLLRLQNVVFRFIPKKYFMANGLHKEHYISLTNSMLNLDFRGKLKDISCAAQIVCGAKDKANLQAAKGLYENIPSAELHLIENTSHEINVEAPEELAFILNAFYSALKY